MSSNKLIYAFAFLASLSISGAASAAQCEVDVKFKNVSSNDQKALRIRAAEAYVWDREINQNNKLSQYNFDDINEGDFEIFNTNDRRGAMEKQIFYKDYSSYKTLKNGKAKRFSFDMTVNVANTAYPVTIRYAIQVFPYDTDNTQIYLLDTVCGAGTHKVELNRALIPTYSWQ